MLLARGLIVFLPLALPLEMYQLWNCMLGLNEPYLKPTIQLSETKAYNGVHQKDKIYSG